MAMRKGVVGGLATALLFFAGCAGYRTAAAPWHTAPAGGEFEVRPVAAVGDRARVVTVARLVHEGVIVGLDASGIRLEAAGAAEDAAKGGTPGTSAAVVVEIAAAEIATLEVYAEAHLLQARNLALGAVAGVGAYMLIDELTTRHGFTVEEAAKGR